MVKVIEKAKLSKKAQKELNAKQRGSWYGVNPVSRVVPNKGKNAYNRSRAKRDARSAMAW